MENEKDNTIGAAAAAVATKTFDSEHKLSNVENNPIYTIRDKLNSLKGNISEVAEKARISVSNALHNTKQSTLAKLKESDLFVLEKYRPIVESAIKIFSSPGTTEKERWDKVCVTNLKKILNCLI